MACPDGKLAYATQGAARKAATVLRRGRGSGKGRKRKSIVYRCPHPMCRAFHLADAAPPTWKKAARTRPGDGEWGGE